MSLHSLRLDRRLSRVLATAASLAFVACSGATAQPSPSIVTVSDADGGPGGTGPASNGADASGPASGGDDDSGAPDAMRADGSISACPAKGSEVVMIGDSYPALSGEIGKQLQLLATNAGALPAGEAYRTYYVSGTNLVGGTSPNIPAQFGEAVAANPDIKAVIMDGGGNDILLDNSECITTQPPPASQTCVSVIADAVSAATALFAQMKTAGVGHVVYYFYPHLPTNGKPYVNTTLDYAYPLVQAACASAPLPCEFVDTRPAFEGHAEYIGPDGIHPTVAGSDVIAGLIWGVMQQACIAQ